MSKKVIIIGGSSGLGLDIAKIFGKRVGKNYYTVLLIHAVVVGVLMFLFTSYILKPIFKMLTTYDVAKSEDKKPKNILENFSIGGKMTCGGKWNK